MLVPEGRFTGFIFLLKTSPDIFIGDCSAYCCGLFIK